MPDSVIDLTGEICPMTFVRTRLALDALAPGQTLLVLLRGADPIARVPLTVQALGHTVLDRDTIDEAGVLRLLVQVQTSRSSRAVWPAG